MMYSTICKLQNFVKCPKKEQEVRPLKRSKPDISRKEKNFETQVLQNVFKTKTPFI